MRILQVAPFFSPQMGGSPQVVYQTARELARRGHAVTVLAGDYGIDRAAFPAQDFQTVIFPSLISRWGFYFTPGMIGWLNDHMAEFQLLHLHEARTFQNIVARWFAVRAGIPYVLSAHGTLPLIVQRQFLKRAFDWIAGNAILHSAKMLVAVSPFEAGQYRQAGIGEERIRVIFNGLNLEEFENLPERGSFRSFIPECDPTARVLLYVGRVHQQKGIHVLIEALPHLQRLVAFPFKLVIVGPDAGEQAVLQALAEQLGVQTQVWFAGPRYGKEKLAALVDADVLVAPASYEIFGLSPFEALLCGTPVVVAQDSGLAALVQDAGAGLLSPYGDAPALAEAVRQVLNEPQLARQMLQNGQQFIRERLDWKKIAAELETLYHDCLQR